MRPYYTHDKRLQERDFFTSTVQTKYGIKRYFSNVEAEIYFGEQFMEDIVRFDYSIEERKMPLYGYNSFYANRIITGQKIIQGTFAINFTNGAFMKNILDKISDSVEGSQFDKTYKPCSDKNMALWSKSFDILLGYGYYKDSEQTYNATSNCLTGVQITGMQHALDVTGEPILEVYSFMAKNYTDGDIPEKEVVEDKKEEDKETPQKPPSEKYIIATEKDESAMLNLNEYCKEHTSTLGISVDIVHNLKNSPAVVLTLDEYHDKDINIQSCKITTNDQRVRPMTLSLDKKEDKVYKHDFVYASLEHSNSLKKVLSKDYKSISCTLELEVIINKKTETIKHSTYIYKGKGY